MWTNFLLVLVGLTLVTVGANYLTDGAASIATRFRIPQLVVGLTIVAFGTSAPELTVSLIAGTESAGGIAVGNVIGSNIFNILAVLGIAAMISPLPVDRNSRNYDIPIAIFAAIVLAVVLSDRVLDGSPDNNITRVEAIMLVLLGGLFILYTLIMALRGRHETEGEVVEAPKRGVWVDIIMMIGGLVGLVYGGQLFVDNASEIAVSLGVSDTLIGLTLVAWGTSLPELATSIVAAIKKNVGIAVGNAIGSNLFNIFFVLGIAGTVSPMKDLQFTHLDLFMQLAAVLIAFGVARWVGNNRITRGEGLGMLLIFLAYNAFLIYSATGV